MNPVATCARLPVLLAGLLVLGAAAAQDWPQRPVRVIVPFAAGGNTRLSSTATTGDGVH